MNGGAIIKGDIRWAPGQVQNSVSLCPRRAVSFFPGPASFTNFVLILHLVLHLVLHSTQLQTKAVVLFSDGRCHYGQESPVSSRPPTGFPSPFNSPILPCSVFSANLGQPEA